MALRLEEAVVEIAPKVGEAPVAKAEAAVVQLPAQAPRVLAVLQPRVQVTAEAPLPAVVAASLAQKVTVAHQAKQKTRARVAVEAQVRVLANLAVQETAARVILARAAKDL